MPRNAKPTLHTILKKHDRYPRSFASRQLIEGETRIGRDYTIPEGIHLPFVYIPPHLLESSGLTPAQVHAKEVLRQHEIPLNEVHFDGFEPYTPISRHAGTFRLKDGDLRYIHMSKAPSSVARHTTWAGSAELKPGEEIKLAHGDLIEFGPAHQEALAKVHVDLRGNGLEMLMVPFRAQKFRGHSFTTSSGKVYEIGDNNILNTSSRLNGKTAVYAAGLDRVREGPEHKAIIKRVIESGDPNLVNKFIIPHILKYGKPPGVGRHLLLITGGKGVQLTSPIKKVE
jgi:hypothetical protein